MRGFLYVLYEMYKMYKCSLGIRGRGERVKQFEVGVYCLAYLADADVFVGGMGTGALAWSEFERGEAHQRLVGEGGGAERSHAEFLK